MSCFVSMTVGAASLLSFSDSGFSSEAAVLREALSPTQDTRVSTVIRSEAISGLWRLFNECAEEGWDGYDAQPMLLAAARAAVDLIRTLPEGLPMPELTAENDGAISLDWAAGRMHGLSVSVNGTERLAYAWLDGARSGSGVELFVEGRWPERLLHEIRGIHDRAQRIALRTQRTAVA